MRRKSVLLPNSTSPYMALGRDGENSLTASLFKYAMKLPISMEKARKIKKAALSMERLSGLKDPGGIGLASHTNGWRGPIHGTMGAGKKGLVTVGKSPKGEKQLFVTDGKSRRGYYKAKLDSGYNMILDNGVKHKSSSGGTRKTYGPTLTNKNLCGKRPCHSEIKQGAPSHLKSDIDKELFTRILENRHRLGKSDLRVYRAKRVKDKEEIKKIHNGIQ
jgi:hypothetical protein